MNTEPRTNSADAIRPSSALWSNSIAQVVGTVLARFTRAAGILISARALGPDVFGRLAASLATYEIVRVVSEAGLDTRLIRWAARAPSSSYHYARRTVFLKVRLASALLVLGSCLALATLGPGSAALFAAVGVGLGGLAVSGSAQAIATARLEAQTLIPYQALAGLVFFAAVSGAVRLQPTAITAALAIGASDLASGMIMLGYLKKLRHSHGSMTQWSDWSALQEAWPVGAVAAVGTAYARLGIGVLAVYWGSAAVAQYGVAYRLVEVFLLASSAVAGSAFAVTARIEAHDGLQEARALLGALLRKVAGPLVLVPLTVVLAARGLPVLFGEAYTRAVGTAEVLAWALTPMFLNGLLTAHLYGLGRYRTVLGIALVNLVVNATLLWTLVPTYGPAAAALAVVLTESLNTAFQSRAAGLSAREPPWWIAGVSASAAIITLVINHAG